AANSGPLGAAEEEQLVLDYSTARGIAKLVSSENALVDAVGVVVEAIRRQRRHAVEFVGRSVKGVRPGSGREVYDAPGSSSVFGREVAGDDLKLLHRIQRHALTDGRGERVVVLAAVEQDVGAGRALSVDREARASGGSAFDVRCVARGGDQRVRVSSQGWEVC